QKYAKDAKEDKEKIKKGRQGSRFFLLSLFLFPSFGSSFAPSAYFCVFCVRMSGLQKKPAKAGFFS
ncbi:MAG: hypothetical protein ABIR26_10050, partial [Ramlibacter sp.]